MQLTNSHAKMLVLLILVATSAFGQAQPVKRVVRCTDSSVGGNDTYTATAAPILSAYSEDQWYEIRVLTANTLAATMDCGPGAKTIVKMTGGVSTTLATNDLVPKGTYIAIYNSTDDNFKIISATGTVAESDGAGFRVPCLTSTTAGASVTNFCVEGVLNSNEGRAQVYMPRACTAQNLRVRTMSSTGATLNLSGGSLAVTIREAGADGALTCTVADGTAACSDLSNTEPIAAGALLSLKLVGGAYTPPPYVSASFECR